MDVQNRAVVAKLDDDHAMFEAITTIPSLTRKRKHKTVQAIETGEEIKSDLGKKPKIEKIIVSRARPATVDLSPPPDSLPKLVYTQYTVEQKALESASFVEDEESSPFPHRQPTLTSEQYLEFVLSRLDAVPSDIGFKAENHVYYFYGRNQGVCARLHMRRYGNEISRKLRSMEEALVCCNTVLKAASETFHPWGRQKWSYWYPYDTDTVLDLTTMNHDDEVFLKFTKGMNPFLIHGLMELLNSDRSLPYRSSFLPLYAPEQNVYDILSSNTPSTIVHRNGEYAVVKNPRTEAPYIAGVGKNIPENLWLLMLFVRLAQPNLNKSERLEFLKEEINDGNKNIFSQMMLVDVPTMLVEVLGGDRESAWGRYTAVLEGVIPAASNTDCRAIVLSILNESRPLPDNLGLHVAKHFAWHKDTVVVSMRVVSYKEIKLYVSETSVVLKRVFGNVIQSAGSELEPLYRSPEVLKHVLFSGSKVSVAAVDLLALDGKTTREKVVESCFKFYCDAAVDSHTLQNFTDALAMESPESVYDLSELQQLEAIRHEREKMLNFRLVYSVSPALYYDETKDELIPDGVWYLETDDEKKKSVLKAELTRLDDWRRTLTRRRPDFTVSECLKLLPAGKSQADQEREMTVMREFPCGDLYRVKSFVENDLRHYLKTCLPDLFDYFHNHGDSFLADDFLRKGLDSAQIVRNAVRSHAYPKLEDLVCGKKTTKTPPPFWYDDRNRVLVRFKTLFAAFLLRDDRVEELTAQSDQLNQVFVSDPLRPDDVFNFPYDVTRGMLEMFTKRCTIEAKNKIYFRLAFQHDHPAPWEGCGSRRPLDILYKQNDAKIVEEVVGNLLVVVGDFDSRRKKVFETFTPEITHTITDLPSWTVMKDQKSQAVLAHLVENEEQRHHIVTYLVDKTMYDSKWFVLSYVPHSDKTTKTCLWDARPTGFRQDPVLYLNNSVYSSATGRPMATNSLSTTVFSAVSRWASICQQQHTSTLEDVVRILTPFYEFEGGRNPLVLTTCHREKKEHLINTFLKPHSNISIVSNNILAYGDLEAKYGVFNMDVWVDNVYRGGGRREA